MSTAPLRYLSEAKLTELRTAVEDNLQRYAESGFSDLERDNGWAIDSATVVIDESVLSELTRSSSATADAANSVIVYNALKGMTPALAAEERIWVRLCHIECFEYTGRRWLSGKEGTELAQAVRKHAFAPGRTGIRDDNALSRLWWNMHIANLADPGDPVGALRLIAGIADIRQAFVERPGTASRIPLARGIVRAMRRIEWLTAAEPNFREFMKVLNRDGSGVLFEALSDDVTDRLMDRYVAKAQAHLER